LKQTSAASRIAARRAGVALLFAERPGIPHHEPDSRLVALAHGASAAES
jgi:hypothetical protein